jgi:peptidoglycan/xylan/chitin deacetylase (PgdA/CDA1 family)
MTAAEPRLVTVMYHYIRDAEKTPFPDIKAVSVQEFRRQVEHVKENFDTPPLEACVEFLEGGWTPRRDICLVTFDDGLREHYDTVAEILLSTGTPGAFFLPTAALEEREVLTVHMNHFLLAALGTGEFERQIRKAADELAVELPPGPTPERIRSVYRWDDEDTARLKYLLNHQLSADLTERLVSHVFAQVLGPQADFAESLYITWNQARSMQASGLVIGGHTHRHKVLAGLDDNHQRADLERSLALLRAQLGDGRRAFAYPYGKPSTYTGATVRYLSDLGYLCAFNTTVDHGRPGLSRWEIPRIDPKDL